MYYYSIYVLIPQGDFENAKNGLSMRFLREKTPQPIRIKVSFLEATTRFELVNQAFAEPCLTTWLRRRM